MNRFQTKQKFREMQSNLRFFFLLGIALLLFVGCTTGPIINTEVDLKEFTFPKKHPYIIGVYYSPEFKKFSRTRFNKNNNRSYTANVGKSSYNALQRILPNLFQGVITLSEFPSRAETVSSVDLILVPEIESFDLQVAAVPFKDIIYRFTVYSPQGIPIESWKVKGSYFFHNPTFFQPFSPIQSNFTSAFKVFVKDLQSTNSKGELKLGDHWYHPQNFSNVTVSNRAGISIESKILDKEALQKILLKPSTSTIIALHVRVKFPDNQDYILNQSKMRLILPDGTNVMAASLSELDTDRAVPPEASSLLLQFSGPILFVAIPFVLADQIISTDEERGERRLKAIKNSEIWKRERLASSNQNLQKYIFDEKQLLKNHQLSGLIFFQTSEKIQPFESATLQVWITKPNKIGALLMEIPVQGI